MAQQPDFTSEPHLGQPVFMAGQPLDRAGAAMVLLHGRGGTGQGMLSLADELTHPSFAYLAPQATGNSWYPLSFLAPVERNEPNLSSALAFVSSVLERLAEASIPLRRTILLGFSQGACLALEYAARYPHRYGGIIGLSGGLIGPNGTARSYPGSLAGTPVFLGCDDTDPHIPKERVIESEGVFRLLEADVTARLYPNMGHRINQDELNIARTMMEKTAVE